MRWQIVAIMIGLVLVAGCAGPQRWDTGLKVVRFAEPYKDLKPRALPTMPPRISPMKILSRADILKHLSKSLKDAKALEELISQQSKIPAAAVWTGVKFLTDPPDEQTPEVNWMEGLSATPNKSFVLDAQQKAVLQLSFPAAFVSSLSGSSPELMAQWNFVKTNFIFDLYTPFQPMPEKVALCFGKVWPPEPASPPADAYLVSVGIKPISPETDFSTVEFRIDGQLVNFSTTETGIVALVELSGGMHFYTLFSSDVGGGYDIHYVNIVKL